MNHKEKIIKTIFFCLIGLIIATAIISVLLTYWRLHYGVDFTDEAFYVALPYRFVFGDKPFIDELNLVQTFSFITYPFVKLYVSLAGGTKGIVLFMRHIYLFFTFLVAGSIFLALKNTLKRSAALAVSLMVVAFVPFNIPNLSYDTLGMGFFTISCFLGLWIILDKKNYYYLFFSGLAQGLAVISYPTLFVPSIFLIFIFSFLLPNKRIKGFLSYASGLLLIGLIFSPIFIKAGWHNLRASLDFINSVGVQGGGINKIQKALSDLWHNCPHKALFLIILTGVFIGIKTRPKFFKYALLFFPLLPLSAPMFYGDIGVPMRYVSYFALLAPYFLLFIGNKKIVKQLFWGIWLPSFIAGMSTAWSSGNGYLNATIGLFPASLVTSIFLIILFRKISSQEKSLNLVYEGLSALPIILTVVILLVFQCSLVYRDDQISALNVRVNDGPFAGLYTTDKKSEYISNLYKDVQSIAKVNDRLVVYDELPAGFLFSHLRPATDTVWLFSPTWYPRINRLSIVNYYKDKSIQPDIAVQIKTIPITKNEIYYLNYSADDPLNNFINSSAYKMILSTEDYAIYRAQL